MSDVPPPAASPQPPKAPDGTTQPGIASTEYVKLKLAQVEERIAATAEESARAAAAEAARLAAVDVSNGKPVVPQWATRLFFIVGAMCAAVIAANEVLEPGDIPRWMMTTAVIGALFCGGGGLAGPGLRRK